MPEQTARTSLVEAVANTTIGMVVSTLAWWALMNLAKYKGWEDNIIDTSLGSAIYVTLFFTVISVIRNFTIRRLFVWIAKRKSACLSP